MLGEKVARSFKFNVTHRRQPSASHVVHCGGGLGGLCAAAGSSRVGSRAQLKSHADLKLELARQSSMQLVRPKAKGGHKEGRPGEAEAVRVLRPPCRPTQPPSVRAAGQG